MTDCRVAASLGIFGAGTGAACLGDLELGVYRRGGGKYGKHRGRELGTRAAHRWPVASLHHPLPGLGSRAGPCQAERPDSISGTEKETHHKLVRERYQTSAITRTDTQVGYLTLPRIQEGFSSTSLNNREPEPVMHIEQNGTSPLAQGNAMRDGDTAGCRQGSL